VAFDESDNSTNAKDSSGHGNSGAWNNGANITHDGKLVEVWIKPRSLPVQNNAFVSKGRLASGNNVEEGYTLYAYSTGAFFVIKTSTDNPKANKANVLSVGTWTHLVGTYGGSIISLYVNGNLVNTTDAGGNIKLNTRSLTIGSSAGLNNFNGTIDEVRIYNRALSAAEIQQQYQYGINLRFLLKNEGSANLGKNFTLTTTTTDGQVNVTGITLSRDLEGQSMQVVILPNITSFGGRIDKISIASVACPNVYTKEEFDNIVC